MNSSSRRIPALSRPLLVAVALGLMAWAFAQETQGAQLSRPSEAQVAQGRTLAAIRETR